MTSTYYEIKENYSLENGIFSVTDLNEYCTYNFALLRASAMSVYFIVAMMLLLEVCMCCVIVILNYKINAIELCLKTVFGHTVIEKNIATIIYNIVISLIAAITNIILLQHSVKYILLCALSLLIFENIITVLQMIKSEKHNISSVLKGK